MCTRFVYNGDDTIVGFNFDIDLSVWEHDVFVKPDRFYIGIKQKGVYHGYHGVNANGNAGTLLYIHGNETGQYRRSTNCYRIDLLADRFNRGELSLNDAVKIAEEKSIVNAPDCTMQVLLSDRSGRVLIAEPGVGYRLEKQRYSLITNYSLLDPAGTRPYITPCDDRYERAQAMLDKATPSFSVENAFAVLREVKQEGLWATRVSFVYAVKQNCVYYVRNNEFDRIREHRFTVKA
ncbi:MAG: conjugal transfer protein [Eubacteriales bacterium]|nr:conjugal transfer protein [Eubacteriales bacterium]